MGGDTSLKVSLAERSFSSRSLPHQDPQEVSIHFHDPIHKRQVRTTGQDSNHLTFKNREKATARREWPRRKKVEETAR